MDAPTDPGPASPPRAPARLEVLVVGGGFAGIGMAIRLRRAGIVDFEILEQAPRVGGTWRDNSYPGAACDVESHLYSFSFAPNPAWSRTFAPQAEILAYLERCVAGFGLGPHLRLGVGVTGARFDEAAREWEVTATDGVVRRARVLVSATGGLNRPALPEIPGLDAFEGPVFHSARWRHDVPLAGKRVAVVGTGASAIQIVPSIAPDVARLDLYQRTPPWILPKADRAITDAERAAFRRVPALQRLARAKQYLSHELLAVGFVGDVRVMSLGERMARRYLAESVRDPALREALTPRYTFGCKRVLLTNDYFPAVQRANVELVTAGIERVTARGVRARGGREREVDALVLATGFQAAEAVAPFPVTGRGGRDLDRAWAGGAEAYLGTSVAGFPNLFLLIGPNTGLGHSSMVLMMESQFAYVLDALRTMRARGLGLVDVRPEEQAAYNARLAARFPKTVWATGCSSWYLTQGGRNTTLWPGTTFEFRLATRRFHLGAYEVAPA